MGCRKYVLFCMWVMLNLSFMSNSRANELKDLYIGLSAGISLLSASDIYPLPDMAGSTARQNKAEESVFQTDLQLGYNWQSYGLPMRSEISYGYRSALSYDPAPVFINDTVNMQSDTRTHSLFANLFYDFYLTPRFSPFVGGGVGWGHSVAAQDFHDPTTGRRESFREHSQNFIWNLSIGGTYAMTQNLFLNAFYRYSDLGQIEYRTQNTRILEAEKLSEHALSLGMRYQF